MCAITRFSRIVVSLLLFTASASTQPSEIDSLLRVADSLYDQQSFDDAITIAQDAMSRLGDSSRVDDSLRLILLSKLGRYQYSAGEFEISDSLHRELLVAQIAFYGPQHRDVAMTLNNLGELTYDRGQYDSAKAYFHRSLQTWNAIGLTRDLQLAFTMNNLANVHADLGEFDMAESLYVASLEMRRDLVGDRHEDVAQSLNNIALIFHEQGRFDDAEPLYKEALSIWESTLGPNHPDLVSGINNLAYLYSDAGRYHLAEPMYERALRIRREALGDNHPYTALSANNLALHYVDVGRFPEAMSLYREALAVWEETLGEDHPRVATVLNNLGSLHMDYGNVAAAPPYFERAYQIRKKALGADHPDLANIIHNLANAYELEGAYWKAESLYTEAIRLRSDAFGSEHEKVALSLNSLAVVLAEQEKYDSAETCLRRAMGIYRNAFGETHPGIALALANLAEVYENRGRSDSALTLQRASLDMRIELFGEQHPEVASGREAVSRCARLTGNYGLAVTQAWKAFDNRLTNLHQSLPVLSEHDALLYSDIMRQSASNYLTAYFAAPETDRPHTRQAATVILSAKGCVTDAMLLRSRLLRSTPDASLSAALDSLQHAQFQLAKLYVRGPAENSTEYKIRVKELSGRINRLESELAVTIAPYQELRPTFHVQPDSIASHLASGAVLVEYTLYEDIPARSNGEQRDKYAAAVISGTEEPFILEIGDASEIDRLVSEWRQSVSDLVSDWPFVQESQVIDADSLSHLIHQKIWTPLAGTIGAPTHRLVSPDGNLNLLAFGLLKDGDSYLIEEGPLHYLTSGRDLVRPRYDQVDGARLTRLAIGSPDYSAGPVERLASLNLTPTLQAAHENDIYTAVRGGTDNCFDLSSLSIDPLPYSRREVNSIAEHWRENADDLVEVCTGAAASEEAVKAFAAGCRMMHIATHGFFSPVQCSTAAGEMILENPLLRSGLFLAGAAAQVTADSANESEDGVLTAQEVSALDLGGCDVVTLSACESGLGETVSGEGVYGLRKAFQQAGAGTVVSSLWQIPDKETARVMKRLYQGGSDRLAGVLRDIMIDDIKAARSSDKPALPYISGAFIVIGDE